MNVVTNAFVTMTANSFHPVVMAPEPGLHAAGKAEGEEAGAESRANRREGLANVARILWDPSQTASISPSSRLLRMVEAVSLLLNLAAFYLIVMANKKLFKDPAKGGYGFTGVGTLGCYHYSTSCLILRFCGSKPPVPFKEHEWRLKVVLVCPV